MALRSIHLGVTLPFETTEEMQDSEEILDNLLAIVCRVNRQYLRRNPNTPSLYESGVVYAPPEQSVAPPIEKDKLQELFRLLKEMKQEPHTAMMVYRIISGIESFLDIPNLYKRGRGDCNELVPVRIAELWRAGVLARPYLQKSPLPNAFGGITYHVIVQWPDKSGEDPSLILGMGGPMRAADRREEIRKNKERWSTYMAAAQHLVQAEGALPEEVGQQIDMMGLMPKDGVFRIGGSPIDVVGDGRRRRRAA